MKKEVFDFRILVFIFLLFISCNSKNSDKSSHFVSEPEKINHNIYKPFIGKKITSISNIFDNIDLNNKKNKLIFLYSNFDCSLCVDKGFYLCNKIDSYFNKQSVYIITSNKKNNIDKNLYVYKYQIFYDENESVKKELGYIKTPVFLLLKDYKLQKIYFIGDKIESQINSELFKIMINYLK